MPKLSPTMEKAVALARRGGGELVKKPGGYWVEPSAERRPGHSGIWGRGPWEAEPDWTETRTVLALVGRGVMEVVDFSGPIHGYPTRVRLV